MMSQTAFHEVNGFSLKWRFQLISSLQIFSDVDIRSEKDHVLLATTHRKTDETRQTLLDGSHRHLSKFLKFSTPL
jgi:hypothetical protein